MKQANRPATTAAAPVDIATMRASVALALPPDVTPTDTDSLETLTGLLRGHMELVIPEIEQLAARLPKDDVPRYCALACTGEARRKLNAARGPATYDGMVYARKLARSLLALCDHYDTLTSIRMCLACDRPIRVGETSLPYANVCPSAGAVDSGRIHDHCANTVHLR